MKPWQRSRRIRPICETPVRRPLVSTRNRWHSSWTAGLIAQDRLRHVQKRRNRPLRALSAETQDR